MSLFRIVLPGTASRSHMTLHWEVLNYWLSLWSKIILYLFYSYIELIAFKIKKNLSPADTVQLMDYIWFVYVRFFECRIVIPVQNILRSRYFHCTVQQYSESRKHARKNLAKCLALHQKILILLHIYTFRPSWFSKFHHYPQFIVLFHNLTTYYLTELLVTYLLLLYRICILLFLIFLNHSKTSDFFRISVQAKSIYGILFLQLIL